jgi:hypothetical protein
LKGERISSPWPWPIGAATFWCKNSLPYALPFHVPLLCTPLRIDAWVVLPEHLHAVWTLPDGDADFSTRWTLIKRGFSARIAKGESRSPSRIAKYGERPEG